MDGEQALESHWFKILTKKYRKICVQAAAEDQIVCVPQTCSLRSWNISKENIDNHILQSLRGQGEFRTNSGRSVSILQSEIIAGKGFSKRVSATILSREVIPITIDGVSGPEIVDLRVYFLSRPLEGGNGTPSKIEDMSFADVSKFVSMLCAIPDSAMVMNELNGRIEDVKKKLISITKVPSERLSFIQASFNNLVNKTTDLLSECDMFVDLDDQAYETSCVQIAQCLESWIADKLYDTIFPLLMDIHEPTIHSIYQTLEDSRQKSADSNEREYLVNELGVKPKFVCDLLPAARSLSKITAARSPLEKLHHIRNCSAALITSVEKALENSHIELSEVDFGSDDELPLLSAAIRFLSFSAPSEASSLPAHLDFCERFKNSRAGDVEMSVLGYKLAMLSQALARFSSSS